VADDTEPVEQLTVLSLSPLVLKTPVNVDGERDKGIKIRWEVSK